jgi:hypothetical protein
MRKISTLLLLLLTLIALNANADSDVYLRGAFNSWGATDDYKFTESSEAGVFTLEKSFNLYGEFKIASSDWSTIDYGSNGSGLTVGTAYTMTSGSHTNVTFATASDTCAVTKITFNKTAGTLLIEGTIKSSTGGGGGGTTTTSGVYLIGLVNGGAWAPNTGVALTKKSDNVYADSISFGSDDRTFGIVTKLGTSATDWTTANDNRFGPATDCAPVATDGTAVTFSKSTNAFKAAAAGKMLCTVDMSAMTITLQAGTGGGGGGETTTTSVYLIGSINGNAMDPSVGVSLPAKSTNVYADSITVYAVDSVNTYGYMGVATKLGTTSKDWATVNANRYVPAVDGTEIVANGAAQPMTKGIDNSWKALPGRYYCTVDLSANTISLTGTPADTTSHGGGGTTTTTVYLIGSINGNAMDPSVGVSLPSISTNVFGDSITVSAVDNVNKFGYMGVTTKLGTTAKDWATVNANRYIPSVDGTEIVANGAAQPMTKGIDNYWKALPGRYYCKVDLTANTISLTGTPADTTSHGGGGTTTTTVYLIGSINGNAMDPSVGVSLPSISTNVYGDSITVYAVDKVNKFGYMGVTTKLGTTAKDWATVNANRYIPSVDGTEIVANSAAQAMVKGIDNSWKALPGRYFCTVDLNANTISLKGTPVDTGAVNPPATNYPAKLYCLGYSNSWAPNDSSAILLPTGVSEGEYAISNIVVAEAAAGTGIGYLSFTSKVSTLATDWDGIKAYRYGPAINGTELKDGIATGLVQVSDSAFSIAAATYKMVVSLKDMTVTATKTSGINGINGNASAKIIAGTGYIRVLGEPSLIEVYNLAGMMISRNQAIINCQRGIYFVKVDGTVTKVIVR